MAVWCCYLGMFIQAVVINLAPLLFIPLRELYGLSFEQLGRLVLINFTTQLLVDLACVGVVDRVGIKPFVVAANLLAALGLVAFAVLPMLTGDAYAGLVIGTVIFSAGCGLLEVLLSPIIDALRPQRKAAEMALLHAFYPVGKVTVILLTGAALWWAGSSGWWWIAIAWAVLPLVNTMAFLVVPLPRLHGNPGREPQGVLMRRPAYWAVMIAMAMAGATEVAIAQWTSAFAQRALGYSQAVADLVGFCLFGVGMIAGRLWLGTRGETVNLYRLLISGAAGSAALYLVAALSPWPAAALLACGLSGLTVSLLWPGTLSLSSMRFPLAGTSMFALLAAAGDSGAAVMPWVVGVIADAASSPEQGLRAGLLVATASPIVMLAVVAWLRARSRG